VKEVYREYQSEQTKIPPKRDRKRISECGTNLDTLDVLSQPKKNNEKLTNKVEIHLKWPKLT
jgi:hypothetical protein